MAEDVAKGVEAYVFRKPSKSIPEEGVSGAPEPDMEVALRDDGYPYTPGRDFNFGDDVFGTSLAKFNAILGLAADTSIVNVDPPPQKEVVAAGTDGYISGFTTSGSGEGKNLVVLSSSSPVDSMGFKEVVESLEVTHEEELNRLSEAWAQLLEDRDLWMNQACTTVQPFSNHPVLQYFLHSNNSSLLAQTFDACQSALRDLAEGDMTWDRSTIVSCWETRFFDILSASSTGNDDEVPPPEELEVLARREMYEAVEWEPSSLLPAYPVTVFALSVSSNVVLISAVDVDILE